MESAMAPCSFIRYSDGSSSAESDATPNDELRRAALQRISASVLALAPANSSQFEVMIPVSNCITVDIDRYGYNQPAATQIRINFDPEVSGSRIINRIEVEGPNQDIFQPRAEYRLLRDGGVWFYDVWMVSNNVMSQIDQALSRMVELQTSS